MEADQCFNLTCHQDKQRTWRQAQASALTPAATAPTQGRPAAPPATGRPAANIPPRKVEEAVDAFYRNTAAQLAEESAAASDTFVLYAVLKDAGFPNDLLQTAGLPVVGLSRATLLPALYALADTARNTLQRQAVAHLAARSALIGTPEQAERVNGAVALVATSGADLATRFRLDRVFLAAHTKAGIEALLNETRNSQGQTFKAWWIAAKGGDPAAFPKLLARKTEDLITTILSSGFDFTGFVPTVVARRVESLQPVLAASIAA